MQFTLGRVSDRGAVRLLVTALAMSSFVAAQTSFAPLGAAPVKSSLCSSEQLAVIEQLTFRQRACWYGAQLVSPWAGVRAAFSSGMGQWNNAPYMKHEDADDFGHRFAVYYVKRSARDSGELIAGYLNREDPRPHLSGERSSRKRIRSALSSVLITRSDEGGRPALAPIAGSLASGFAGAASYRHTGTDYALRGASITYCSYFGRALYHEFQPDISFFVHRMLHKERD
jgi:hypothetical protein